ncbi:MAG: hypothetical protein ACODAD_06620 [Planctomycetota bacterium]
MHRSNECFLLFGLAMAVLLLSGCGDSTPVLDTEPVEGVVTLDGEPVPEATVMFSPVNEGEGTAAAGMTDAEGEYRLTAQPSGGAKGKPGAGTTPGEYYVGVIKTETEGGASPEEEHEQAMKKGSQDASRYEEELEPEKEKTYVVPQEYNVPKDSGIKVTVSEGKNDIPIELSSN